MNNPQATGYNPQAISQFFDTYGEKEWERLVATPRDQVSFYIHTHYLQKFIKAGDSVLEAARDYAYSICGISHLMNEAIILSTVGQNARMLPTLSMI